jgi:DNA-binding NarL/FixJ family response regulator
VLLAEDGAVINLTLEDALVDGGYEVAGPFASGSTALAWLRDHTPDPAIMDLVPGDGPASSWRGPCGSAMSLCRFSAATTIIACQLTCKARTGSTSRSHMIASSLPSPPCKLPGIEAGKGGGAASPTFLGTVFPRAGSSRPASGRA